MARKQKNSTHVERRRDGLHPLNNAVLCNIPLIEVNKDTAAMHRRKRIIQVLAVANAVVLGLTTLIGAAQACGVPAKKPANPTPPVSSTLIAQEKGYRSLDFRDSHVLNKGKAIGPNLTHIGPI
jgi:hypothetical protein